MSGNIKIAVLTVASLLIPLGLIAQEISPEPVVSAANASATSVLEYIPPEIKFKLFTLGSGGIAGWAVGYTLKKFAKFAALIVGISFISLQYLAYNQYISINWERIRQSMPKESLERSYAELMSVITYNLPFAGSFIIGVWLGFRKG